MIEPPKIIIVQQWPPVHCPLCDQPVADARLIILIASGHGAQGFHVCGRHLVPEVLVRRDPRLAPLAADEVIRRTIERAACLTGRALPSRRRDAVRTRIDPQPASDAHGEAGQGTLAHGALAGFWDRALGLLAELMLRIFSAGEGVRPSPATPSAEKARCE